MSRAVRIGYVVHGSSDDGAGRLMGDLVAGLGPAVAPTVFVLGPAGGGWPAGVEVVGLDRRPGRDFAAGKRLAAEVRGRRVEVLHAAGLTPFAVAAWAKVRLWPMPRLVLTVVDTPPAAGGAGRAVNRLLDHLADAVTAASDTGRRALCRGHGFRGGRIRVVRPGVDVEWFHPAEDAEAAKSAIGLDPERRLVVHTARLRSADDQATLLQAFAAAAAEHPDADLLDFAGDAARVELEQHAARLNIRPRVRFLGDRSDRPAVLRAADVFVQAGGRAGPDLLEAMASGLPAVVPVAGDFPELVRDGRDGFLFPAGDATACGRRLADLLDDPGRAYFQGQSARARVVERHRPADAAAAYAELYRRLAGR